MLAICEHLASQLSGERSRKACDLTAEPRALMGLAADRVNVEIQPLQRSSGVVDVLGWTALSA